MSLFGKDTYNYIKNEIDYDKLASAIVKAQELKEISDAEKFKKTKPSIKAKILMCILGFFTFAFIVFGVISICEKEFANGAKLFLFATIYGLLIYSEYIMSKTKNKNIIFNISSIIIAVTSFVLNIVTDVL